MPSGSFRTCGAASADRGEPSLALMPIAEYRRLTKTDKNLVELLRLREADAFDLDFEPIRINAKDI
ncbi:hypothetical protein QTI27_35635 [Variovorax sp. J31P216]|nr:hypothetical protein [Variovorax sp. J31P216]